MIVDNLRVYNQPVFVYLPPNCELRGGAWVVVDPTINIAMMEMYADPLSRGGVLEPEGLVSIKFREKTKRETMYRLDEEYRRLDTALHADDCLDTAVAQAALNERYEQLEGMYHQVAVHFADLHDTAGRMRNKECIREIVEWSRSRKYFYWRLNRRLSEERVSLGWGGVWAVAFMSFAPGKEGALFLSFSLLISTTSGPCRALQGTGLTEPRAIDLCHAPLVL
jgi:acetyl-CoA carboxylase/biotin carboxylase 1